MPWTTPGTATAGDVLTAAFWNTNVRDNTNALYSSIQRLGYQSRTTNYSVTSTTIAGASDIFTAITFTADGTSSYRVEFFCPSFATGSTAGSSVTAVLVDGSGTDLGNIADSGFGDGTRSYREVVHSVYYYTPAAGSRTINVRAYNTTSNGSLNCGAGGAGNRVPMWFAVFGPPQA